MVWVMKRPSSPHGRLACAGLLIAVVLTLLGHVYAESLADVGRAYDTHHSGPAESPASAHAVLCVATLFGGAPGDAPTPSRMETALLATTLPVVAKAVARTPGMGAAPAARSGDGSPPLFLLHATFLI